MAVREGRWDCQYCGTKGILGRHKVCPQCARSRPEGTKFYLPDEENEPEVQQASLLAQAAIGPDWICEYCRSSNAADVEICHHCAAPRESTSPQQQVKSFDLDEIPTTGDMDLETPPERQPAPAPAKQQGLPKWAIPAAGVGALLIVCLALAALLFNTSNVDVTVADIFWERSIPVEALETVVEEDWDLPDSGRLLEEREEIREYEQVIVGYETKQRQVSERVQVGQRTYVCGQEDLGNGFFRDVECSEPIYETQSRTESYEDPIYSQQPVYDTLYKYEIDRWNGVRTEVASGNDLSPYWPEFVLGSGEREGEPSERYEITFVDDEGKHYQMEFPEEEWRTFEPNGRYQLEVNGFGDAVEVVR